MSWWLAVPLGALIVVGVAVAYVAGVVVFVWAVERVEHSNRDRLVEAVDRWTRGCRARRHLRPAGGHDGKLVGLVKRTELRRKTEIERTPFRYSPGARKSLAKKPRVRSWRDARAKVEGEARCRVCGSVDALQAAHSVARAVQDVKGEDTSFLWVNPDSVIPLCPPCHMAFDSRRLSLLGLLTLAELRNAVAACRRAKIDCRRRLGGGRT